MTAIPEITDLQRRTIDAILSVFETGTVTGAYSSVVFSPGDKGQLTYGKHQTTLASGNLAKMIDAYVARLDTQFGEQLEPYVPRLKAHEEALNHDGYLKNLLRAAADDKQMRDTQDEFFASNYQQPAFKDAVKRGFNDALSWAVRYDGQVHGSWKTIADETDADVGAVTPATERKWISTYVALRRKFLASGSGDLPKTVYRMDAFRSLIDIGAWDLKLPLVVRDLEISEATLNALPTDVYDGPAVGSRVISVATPIMKGLDVRLVQLALSRPGVGIDIAADGKFGQVSAKQLNIFKKARALPETGSVDQQTLQALGLA
jgi:chitosanase